MFALFIIIALVVIYPKLWPVYLGLLGLQFILILSDWLQGRAPRTLFYRILEFFNFKNSEVTEGIDDKGPSIQEDVGVKSEEGGEESGIGVRHLKESICVT